MAFELYIAHCEPTGKQYIGITSKGYRARWARHVSDARRGSQTALHKAIRKHGEDAFQLAVLCKPETVERLKQAEIWSIEKLGTLAPRGYNLTRGGDGVVGGVMPESWYAGVRAAAERRRGVKRPPEIGLKVAAAQRGRKGVPMTQATKERLRLANTGREKSLEEIEKVRAALKGKRLNADHRAKLSEAHKGIRLSQEAKEKLSAHWKGRTFSEEHRAKLSASQKGRQLSPEHIEKLRIARQARAARERAQSDLS